MDSAKNRITVVEKIYHQTPEEQPTEVNVPPFSRELESDEQPYIRQMAIGEEWRPLDRGWVEQAGLLSIHNKEGVFLPVIPTPAELATITSRIVEVRYKGQDEGWLIHPRESMRAVPSDLSKLVIRCLNGTARISIVIIPK